MIFTIKGTLVAALFFIFLLIPQNEVQSSPESELINNWAVKFGDKLWELAETMTKAKEIKQRYKSFNARVEKKNGMVLIDSIVESVGRMLGSKMDAVKCIVNKSEEWSLQFHQQEMAKENFSYYSSKFSPVNGLNLTSETLTKNQKASMGNYTLMSFDADSHFFKLQVNTSHSSVHVPTNVFDQDAEEAEFIQWSEALDGVFRQNYQSDPALSWQYFGSNLGVMRHFPALAWDRNNTDTYDCRKRSWYIETATCSKDVIILLDNSGSMHGYRKYVAQLTIKSLLDTFSNNDFVTVFNYSSEITALIPCLNETLVQATPENVEVFNKAVDELDPLGYANVTKALDKAFRVLENYREIHRCHESASGCNQAIMLITDGVPGNATEVFEKHNWSLNNVTRTPYPVRVFTYLLGKEVTKVKEIQNYACMNRGYYSHVQSLDQVAEEVLQYVNVIAAPLVLQRKDRPPTWTHAYLDETYKTDQAQVEDDTSDFRMMIAVGVPAFNLSSYGDDNEDGNSTNKNVRPLLLGVAGTDVPIDNIKEMALPYKLGVNAYSFIVSNNGYVLLHPELSPFDSKFKKELKVNYNSIDITELEQIDDNVVDGIKSEEPLGPRVLSDKTKELRYNLVYAQNTSSLTAIPVRFHYDQMRRVAETMQDYYIAPIPFTPFTLGLALPHEYGNTWIKVGDEIQRNNYTKINISDFFVGSNWKVHPDWVYCRYHYLEGHEFAGTVEELRHFLKKIIEPEWRWSQQYEAPPGEDKDAYKQQKGTDEVNCGRQSLGEDAYYCNKELVELLVFDAKVTNESYQSWTFKGDQEKIVMEYNATVRFVSTMSGLTRWQFIFGEEEVEGDKEFGDLYEKAIDETWYQSAIIQHHIDKNSFVYSVPHEGDEDDDAVIKVTASMAIFPRDGGLEAPSCVVGFQFSHALMKARFMEITSTSECDDCEKMCGSDEQFCYVIDNNGFVLISENEADTGRFFGEIEKPIMESMVHANIYKKITVYDLQGLCLNTTYRKYSEFSDCDNCIDSAGSGLLTPFKLILLGFKWMMAEMIIELSRINLWVQSVALPDYGDEDYEGTVFDGRKEETKEEQAKVEIHDAGPHLLEDKDWYKFMKNQTPIPISEYYACDKRSELFVLQKEFIEENRGYSLEKAVNGSNPFVVHRIPNSNLLLVFVNKMKGLNNAINDLTTDPKEIDRIDQYDCEHPCHKIYMNELPRRRLDECFTSNPKENSDNWKFCGAFSSRLEFTVLLLVLPFLYLMGLN